MSNGQAIRFDKCDAVVLSQNSKGLSITRVGKKNACHILLERRCDLAHFNQLFLEISTLCESLYIEHQDIVLFVPD